MVNMMVMVVVVMVMVVVVMVVVVMVVVVVVMMVITPLRYIVRVLIALQRGTRVTFYINIHDDDDVGVHDDDGDDDDDDDDGDDDDDVSLVSLLVLGQRQEATIHLRMTRGKRQEAGGTGPGQRAIFHVRGKVCG